MKKEIYCGFDLTEFNHVRDALDRAGIDHTHKVVDLYAPSCLAALRTVTDKTAPMRQYYVYVSGDDFEKAQVVTKKV